MTELLLALTPISLIDSFSLLPFAVVVLSLTLAGRAPYLSSLSFLLGILLSYFAAGLMIAVGLGGVIERVTAALVHWFKHPSALDYILSIIIGIALIALGHRWAMARGAKAQKRQASEGMSPPQAFVVGAGATIAGLWGALPYFAAIDQLLKADVSTGEAVFALAYYNILFVSLAAVLVLIRAIMGSRAAALLDAVNRLLSVWGSRLIIGLMIVLGAVMVADGVGWLFGRPIIPVG